MISDIVVGVEAEADRGNRPNPGHRCWGNNGRLTLKESFKGAFMMGNMLEIEFSGIPEGAS